MRFRAFNPYIKQLRTDKGWRVELDVSQDQYEIIQDLPNYQEEILVITINREAQEKYDKPTRSQYAYSEIIADEIWPDEKERKAKIKALCLSMFKKEHRNQLTKEEIEKLIDKLEEIRSDKALSLKIN